MTASVTIAPITPATAVEMPEDDEVSLEVEPELEFELELEDEPLLAYAAHAPVVLPHAEHQDAGSPMAILLIWSANVFQGRTVWFRPKSGYAVKPCSAAEPLENMKRTET